jgi:hypothetical protein
MATEPMVPFRGTKNTPPDPGRLVTHRTLEQGWQCRWCYAPPIPEVTKSGDRVLVCLPCDRVTDETELPT